MKFYDDHDYDRSLRTGRKASRKPHDVKVCGCGMQAWALVNATDVVMVNIEDRALVDLFRWTMVTKGRGRYAESPTVDLYLDRGRSLHLNIAKRSPGFEVDHLDGNELNCMRKNLRYASKAQNQHNRKAKKNKKGSRFKGVTLSNQPLKKKWAAKIIVDEISVWLGRHETEEAAAMAYDAAAKKHFGSFARLNFPEMSL